MSTNVVFSFDTTGSMVSCLAQVRANVDKVCDQLFDYIPNLKIGLIAHGDYCDGPKCLSSLPLTDDRERVKRFVRETPDTGGGDSPECYELALRTALRMGWQEDAGKMLVVIGDDVPHEVSYPGNVDRLDWKEELGSLKAMGVRTYPLQCLFSPGRPTTNKFWSDVGELSGTPLLKLENFSAASETLVGYAYASAGSEAFAAHEERVGSVPNAEVLREEAKLYISMGPKAP